VQPPRDETKMNSYERGTKSFNCKVKPQQQVIKVAKSAIKP
jgi:hypothetical protein